MGGVICGDPIGGELARLWGEYEKYKLRLNQKKSIGNGSCGTGDFKPDYFQEGMKRNSSIIPQYMKKDRTISDEEINRMITGIRGFSTIRREYFVGLNILGGSGI